MPTLSPDISKNKGAKSEIQIVSNRTILIDYFQACKSIPTPLIFRLMSFKVCKNRNLTKKDFKFLASKAQKISKKDFHSIFGRQLAKF